MHIRINIHNTHLNAVIVEQNKKSGEGDSSELSWINRQIKCESDSYVTIYSHVD